MMKNGNVLCAVDWPSYMACQDMLWKTRPLSWDEGAFIGNGWLGAMVYGEEHREKRHVLRFVLGNTDVIASRPRGQFPHRVPIGELALECCGMIYHPFEMRVDLWNAEIRAVIPTTKGEIKLRAFIHAEAPVLTVEWETDSGEQEAKLVWYADPEVSPVLKNADTINLNQFIPATKVRHEAAGDLHVGVQDFGTGEGEGCITTWGIWHEETGEGTGRTVCHLNVTNGTSDEARKASIQAVREAAETPRANWIKSHRSWWNAYYPASFVSLPDPQLESFYWIQMYKLASATRADAPLIDNQGPWLTSTPWPGVWFNMNVQMSYSPVYTSNRLELGRSLIKALDENRQQLIDNVPQAYREDSAALGRSCSYDLKSPVSDEVGNLTWILHSVWRHYRYSMDQALLRDVLYPLLRRSICYYMHVLEEGEDGRLHLPPMVSPEYGSFKQIKTADSHYDLALLRWGCLTLQQAVARLGIEDPLQERWQVILERLAPLPVDETGYRIGADYPLEFGHRHFSHLLAAFPLHLVGETEEEKALILRSLRHWIDLEGDLRGFSFTGAASIAAALGLGDVALGCLNTLMQMIKPNTMYKEAGPVIETPLAGAESIQDMLLQSWGDRIRVFPAIPETWQEVLFHNLRAEGGFLVSATRKAGQTAWICVHSLAGEPCRLAAGSLQAASVTLSKPDTDRWQCEPDGSIELWLSSGEHALLSFQNEESPVIKPVTSRSSASNVFGGKKPWRLYGIPQSTTEPTLVVWK